MKKQILAITVALMIGVSSQSAMASMLYHPKVSDAPIDAGYLEYQRGNYEKAKASWTIQAGAGNLDAMAFLANYYSEGRVTSDFTKAVKYLEKPLKADTMLANFYAGVMYYDGHGFPQDYRKAFEYWEKAAEQGSIVALYNLAICYEQGQGTPIDLAKAAEIYRIVADPDWVRKDNIDSDVKLQVSSALVSLSDFYLNAKGGLPRNQVLAYALALESEVVWSNVRAKQQIDYLQKTLNPRLENNGHYVQFELNRPHRFYPNLDSYARRLNMNNPELSVGSGATGKVLGSIASFLTK